MPTNIRGDDSAARLPSALSDTRLRDEDIEEFKATVLAKLTLAVGKDAANATDRDWFVSTALALRDRIIHRWLTVDRASDAKGCKRVYYLSLEFLIGRLLNDVVGNLRCGELVRVSLGDLGVDPDRMRSAEPDAALGNGGLGRLVRSIRSTFPCSMRAITWEPFHCRRGPKRSPKFSIRATTRRPGANCGCARNTSSCPPRCRTSCVATPELLAASIRFRNGLL